MRDSQLSSVFCLLWVPRRMNGVSRRNNGERASGQPLYNQRIMTFSYHFPGVILSSSHHPPLQQTRIYTLHVASSTAVLWIFHDAQINCTLHMPAGLHFCKTPRSTGNNPIFTMNSICEVIWVWIRQFWFKFNYIIFTFTFHLFNNKSSIYYYCCKGFYDFNIRTFFYSNSSTAEVTA